MVMQWPYSESLIEVNCKKYCNADDLSTRGWRLIGTEKVAQGKLKFTNAAMTHFRPRWTSEVAYSSYPLPIETPLLSSLNSSAATPSLASTAAQEDNWYSGAMAQITSAADGGARSLPGSSVRPSWSYETVAMEEHQDTGRVAESNILDAPRRRKRPRRLQEATDTEMVVDGQARERAMAVNSMSVDMNAVPVPDVIDGGPSAQQRRDNNVGSAMRSKGQETMLGGIPRERVEKLVHGSVSRQQLQHAFSPLGHLGGPQTGTSSITHAPNEVSHPRTWENTCPSRPIVPGPEQMQEVNSIQEGTSWKNSHMALPHSPGPENLFTTNTTRSSHPHEFERSVNSSTAGLLGSAQAPELSRWALDNVSVSDLGFHSDHSIPNAIYAKQAVLGERALNSSNTPTPRQPILKDGPTTPSFDMATTAISPMVGEIEALIFRDRTTKYF
jgi:hypothetical protein